MAAVPARFLGLLLGAPIYEGDTVQVFDDKGDWVPARLIDVERGDDGLPRVVVAPATRFHTAFPLCRVGKVLYSMHGPNGSAAKSRDELDREHQAKLAEEARMYREAKVEQARQAEFIERVKASVQPAVNGTFVGYIEFGGVKVRMNQTVVFLTGTEKQIGIVVGYRSTDNLLLVVTIGGNYAVTESEFLGVLQPARKD